MTHNAMRAARMKLLSVQELKKRAESGTLGSAAALYELHRRGEWFFPTKWWLGPQ